MSSDVCISTSDDEDNLDDEVQEKHKNFIKVAKKGWSTCSNGFADFQSEESALSSSNYDSPNTSINKPKKARKKKHIRQLSGKYSGLKEIQLQPSSSFTECSIMPVSASKTTLQYSSPSANFSLIKTPTDTVSKAEEPKKWSFINPSTSFHITPTKLFNSDREESEIFTPVKIQMDLSPTSPENIVEISSCETYCSQNKIASDLTVVPLKSSLILQESDEYKKVDEVKNECLNNILHSAESFYGKSLHNTMDSSYQLGNSYDISKLDSFMLQKGSDWIKSINWQQNIAEGSKVDDQEEKMCTSRSNKFIAGGLAEYAVKLAKKERSSRLIWLHKKAGNLRRCYDKCLSVKLGHFQSMDGLVLSKCEILKKPTAVVNCSTDNPNLLTNKISINHKFSRLQVPCSSSTLNCDKLVNHSENESLSNLSDVTLINQKPCDGKEIEYCFLLLRPSIMREFKLDFDTIIRIHPPWQSLNVPSLPYPVILRTYYIDVLGASINKTEPIKQPMKEVVLSTGMYHVNEKEIGATSVNESAKSVKQPSGKKADIRKFLILPSKSKSNCDVVNNSAQLSHWWTDLQLDSKRICGEEFSLCAVVHRIWQQSDANLDFRRKYSLKNIDSAPIIRHYLLIQDKNYRFYKLLLQNINGGDDSWHKLLQRGEGKCFLFKAVKIDSTLHSSRYQALFTILKDIWRKQQGTEKQDNLYQSFCYQLITNCNQNVAVHVPSIIDFPMYYPYEISPLSQLNQVNNFKARFSCCVKILCRYNNSFYVTDKSLLNTSCCPYMKITVWSSGIKLSSTMKSGSNVVVIEAINKKDFIFVDKYSNIIPLCVNGNLSNADAIINELSSFLPSDSCCWKRFCHSSQVEDIVVLKGTILSVEEDTAISWLECGSCGKENLYQDSECRIFCDVCCSLVKQPVLNMKMTVSVSVVELYEALVMVELSCVMTKKLLKIPENIFQPKCNMEDVLHKKIGPLVCCIQFRECVNSHMKFYLREIVTI